MLQSNRAHLWKRLGPQDASGLSLLGAGLQGRQTAGPVFFPEPGSFPKLSADKVMMPGSRGTVSYF